MCATKKISRLEQVRSLNDGGSGKTIATSGLTDEQLKQEELEKQKWQKALLVIFDYWLLSYQEGDLPFETFCRNVIRTANVLGLPKRGRHRLIGEAIEKGCSSEPPKKKGRGRKQIPKWLIETAKELVDAVHDREGLVISKVSTDGSQTAFERAAEILQGCGIHNATVDNLAKWRERSSKSNPK